MSKFSYTRFDPFIIKLRIACPDHHRCPRDVLPRFQLPPLHFLWCNYLRWSRRRPPHVLLGPGSPSCRSEKHSMSASRQRWTGWYFLQLEEELLCSCRKSAGGSDSSRRRLLQRPQRPQWPTRRRGSARFLRFRWRLQFWNQKLNMNRIKQKQRRIMFNIMLFLTQCLDLMGF